MALANFRHGDPTMIEYTPAAGAVSAGDVVLIGNTTGVCLGVAHLDIANNALGALDIFGGIYDVTNLNNAANGAKVWWDGTNKVTTTSTNNAQFGFVVENGGGGANTTCTALLDPLV